jgi:hypothetical protein
MVGGLMSLRNQLEIYQKQRKTIVLEKKKCCSDACHDSQDGDEIDTLEDEARASAAAHTPLNIGLYTVYTLLL